MAEINWNAVYGFWLVAGHGSFASAAKTLPRGSIQALHKRVRQLENPENLDLKLLKSRGVKGTQLTEAGRRLHDFVDPVFRSFELLTAELRGEDSGPLAVAMSWYAIANYAEKILQPFHRLFPAVSIRLVGGEPAEAVPLLEQGRVDVVISSPWAGSSRMVVKAAVPIQFGLIAVPRYRLRTPLTWDTVLEHPFVLTDRNSVIRQAFEDLLRREKLLSRLRITAEVATLDLAIYAVRAGLGVGLVPVSPALARSLRGLRRRRPPPGLPRVDLAVMCRSDVYLPRYMRTFVEIAAGKIGARTALV